jgi:POT family proton-dependent oligopeptide transporter
LGALIPATGDKFKKAQELGIDLQAVLNKTAIATPEQLKLLEENQISASNPVFVGMEIHNLYEFFMVFVVLTGIAAVLLFLLTPLLRKMMHGIK